MAANRARRRAALALSLAASAGLLGWVLLRDAPAAPLPLPPAIVAADPAITVTLQPGAELPAAAQRLDWVAQGRVRADADGGVSHEWPGFGLVARFAGDSLLFGIDDAAGRYRLEIDGAAVAGITRPGQGLILVSGLGAGPHELRLDSLAESWAPGRITGLAVPQDGAALAPPALPARRIDVYGDSDSVGFGNAHDGRDCAGDDVFLSTDVTRAWPALLAGRFAAQPLVIARSGIGLVRNHGGAAPGLAMATLHDRALPSLPGPAAPSPAPWLTLVAVGDNDFAVPLAPDEDWADMAALSADFNRTLERFLRGILDRAPGRPVLVLLFADAGIEAHDDLTAVSAALAAEGAPVATVALPALDRTGCLWHPSLADHVLIAGTLAQTIDTLIATGRLEAP